MCCCYHSAENGFILLVNSYVHVSGKSKYCVGYFDMEDSISFVGIKILYQVTNFRKEL